MQGAVNATKCVSLRRNEPVLILAEKANIRVGGALRRACEKKTKRIDFFVMEQFGKRPLRFLPEELREAAKRCKVAFSTVGSSRKGKLNERFTVRKPLTDLLMKHNVRFAAMVGVDEECMKQGMCVDYKKIQLACKALYSVVKNAKQITVSSPHGTALVVDFSPKLKWLVADGNIEPGTWSNLPDGEVFTCPANVNGIAVINGSLGDVFSRKYKSLEKTPVRWHIVDSRIVAVECHQNRKLEAEFKRYIKLDRNSNRIGEFAVGANYGVKKIIGNLLQDEKIVGVHMAAGYPYPELTGAKWNSKVHCDGVITKPTVFVDGMLLMDNGKFVF